MVGQIAGKDADMDADRRAYVETMMDVAADFSDGAFLGFMEEKGIDIEEVLEVSHLQEAEQEPQEPPKGGERR